MQSRDVNIGGVGNCENNTIAKVKQFFSFSTVEASAKSSKSTKIPGL
jgi:hypothetical protein